jgi:DNA-binding CsgD family transcriptional regulator
MKASTCTITPTGNARDAVLLEETLRLYASEPDLRELPEVVFGCVGPLVDADVVGYTEGHHATKDFRALVSVEDDPATRKERMLAFARHMHTHPFWQYRPEFYGERALRESDFFSDEEFLALPIAREAFLPSHARRLMSIVIPEEGYVLSIGAWRVTGRPAFSDEERDRMQAFRAHLQRVYRQAQERTLARLPQRDRLRYAFPDLTPRQLDVATLLAQGMPSEEITARLDIGIDTLKAHTKAINRKLGTRSQINIAVLALTTPPFSHLPPLWKLGLQTWDAAGNQSG